MSNRFRHVIWRELPFSARRALLGSVRALDDFERALIYFWRNLYYSPAWLFVAVSGSIGIVLTILLFISLSRELLARAEGQSVTPRIEVAELDPTLPPRWDTRLCLEDGRLASVPYDAEFAFGRSLPPLALNRQPPVVDRLPPRPPRMTPVLPVKEAPEPLTAPELATNVELLRHPTEPVVRPELFTARSVLAELNLRDVTSLPDGWDQGRDRPVVQVKAPPPYAGDPELNVAVVETEDLWNDPSAWPTRADVALRIELHAPKQAAVGLPGQSQILIRNDGDDPVRRIEVRESLPMLPLVTDASPSGRMQSEWIDREFRRLRPTRDRSLSLTWFATTPGEYQHEAQVLAEAVVAATVLVEAAREPMVAEPVMEDPPVEVPIEPEPPRRREPRPARPPEPLPAEPEPEPLPEREPVAEPAPAPVVVPPPVVKIPPRRKEPNPAIACRVQSSPTVKLNDVVELKVEVRNTGETALHNVRIWADVPSSLRHRHGAKLEYPVGKLDPGQVHHSVLRVVGEKAGAAVAAFRVVSDENIRADATGKVAVTAPKPTKPVTIAKPARPALTTPTCPCECQAASGVVWAGYEF